MAIEPPDPPLADGVVTLRPWGEPGDVEAITAACNDRAIAEFLDLIPSPYSDVAATARTRRGKLLFPLLEVALGVAAPETDGDPIAEGLSPLLLQPVAGRAHSATLSVRVAVYLDR